MKTFERDHYAEMFNTGLASIGAAIATCEATVKKCDEILRRRQSPPKRTKRK
jgi:hypothetical protein